MYLISEEQYKEYYDLKSKHDEKSQTVDITDQPTTSETTPNASTIEEMPSSLDLKEKNLETGTGSRDIDLKKNIQILLLTKIYKDSWKTEVGVTFMTKFCH